MMPDPAGRGGDAPAPVTRAGNTVRVRALVSGRVQGVWFRDSCRREAARLGLAGWVRNRPDGRVEIEAEGARDRVEALLAWAREGPPLAAVAGLEIADLPPTGERTFAVR